LYLNDGELVSLGDAIQLWGDPIGTTTRLCVYPTHGYMTIFFEGDVQVDIDPSRQVNNTILLPSALTPNTVIKEIG